MKGGTQPHFTLFSGNIEIKAGSKPSTIKI